MKNLYTILVLLILSFLQNQITGQNCIEQLKNPSFESDLNNWNISGNVTVTSDAFTGTKAAKICDGPGGFNQVFPTSPGKTYEVSFWYKTDPGHTFSVYQIRSLDASWNPIETQAPAGQIYYTGGGITGNNQFDYQSSIEYTFTTPPGAVRFQVSVWNEGAGCLNIDDFKVCESNNDPPNEPNLEIIGTPCPLQYPSTGSLVTVPFTVKNTGGSASAPSKIYLYRQLSCRFCSPSNLGQIDVPTLQPNEEINLEVSGALRGLLPGIYNIQGRLVQSIWGNLFLSDEIAQYPNSLKEIDFYCKKFNTDLEIDVIPVNSEYDNDGEISFKLKAKNTGNQAAYNAKVVFLEPIGIYNFTLDAVVQTTGTTLESTNEGIQWSLLPILPGAEQEIIVTYKIVGSAPGQLQTLPNSFTVNASISSGHNTNTYTANDTDAATFTKAGRTQLGDDGNLTLSAAGSASAIDAWQFGEVTFTIKNEGSIPVSDIGLQFILDDKLKLKGGDEFAASQGVVGSFWSQAPTWVVGNLLGGESATITFNTFALSGDLMNFYGQITNSTPSDPTSTPNNGINPSPNEDDEAVWVYNGGIAPVREPDLTISNLFLEETTIQQGEVLHYKFDIANIGSENVPEDFVVRAYLSTDGDISPDDIQDGIVPTGNFKAGFSVTEVPGASTINLPLGQYYIILKVDADEQIGESDEENNMVQSFIQFTVTDENPNPVACDKPIGKGNFNCFEAIPGTDNFKIAYDSSGWQIIKTLDANLDIVGSLQTPSSNGFPRLEIDTSSLKKVNEDGSLIYQRTLPQSLMDKMPSFPHAIEYQNGYIFLAWRNSPGNQIYRRDELHAIRTDGDFNILFENQVAGSSGDPYASRNSIMQIVGQNQIAFTVTAGFSTSQTYKLVLMDDSMQLLDEVQYVSGVFAVGNNLFENLCDRFTVSDFIGFSYCKSGGCYGNNVRDVDFSTGKIRTVNSAGFQHRTTVGIGFESWNWFTETSDGGTITAARTQNLPIMPGFQGQSNPLDERINFTKNDADGAQVERWSVVVPGAKDVIRIFEENGKVYLVKKTGDELSISELDCFDSPTGTYDLEIFNVSVPDYSGDFARNEFSVRNNGNTASPASAYQAFLSTDDVLSADDRSAFNSLLNLPSIAPGETLTIPLSVFISDDLPKGQQIWVFISLDPQNLLGETDENNNIGFNSFFNPGDQGNGPDLELIFGPITQGPPPAQWSYFSQNLTVQNTGTETATGIQVEFKKDVGVVYKGNDEFTATKGSFQHWDNEIWDIGPLAPGESAVLTVNYFRLSANALNLYAQVYSMDQADADSTPGNGNCCVSNEDDEAVLVIDSPSAGAVGSRSSIAENLDRNEAFAILNAFPNPTFDHLTLEVFSNENQSTNLIIYDVPGRPVFQELIELQKGLNSIFVDTSDFPSGILTITMSPNHPFLRQVRVLKIVD